MVLNLGMVEIVVLFLFFAWCAGVFVFLRFLSARATKSAAEPEPGREELDELIAKVERGYSKRDSES